MWETLKRFFGFGNASGNPPGDAQQRNSPDWIYRHPTPHLLFPVESGAVVNKDTAVSWTAIWRALMLIGSAIGSMPFTIIEEEENGDVRTRKNHPLWKMINMEPHPFYSTFDFLQAVMFQVLLRGNAVIVINRIGQNGGMNRPGTLRLIKWEDVHDVKEENGQIWYSILGYEDKIPHQDIIHIKGLSEDGICAFDTLKWNREGFGLALSTRRAAAAYHKNGTHSEGFLSTDQQINPDKREDIQKAWNAKTRSGETPLLTGGIKWERMGITPKDLQLLEVQQYHVYEAARIIGVSPHLLFALDRANFSNIETLSLEFGKYTLGFWVERIEQEFKRKIFRKAEMGRLSVKLNMDAFMRGDTESRTKYIEGLIDRGVITLDEARRMEGYNAIEDGKGQTHLVPMNYQTLEQMQAGQMEEDSPEEPNENPPADEDRATMNGHARHTTLN